ncbi:hypothetical protein CMI37_31630 [Candidatus Pacearchaeota archaeon]|nr:hypothetical protein [Candidatus Pacearchaeota archaeon]|tara:strand:- start:2939 stop:3217 length:279 start_codon:yes stop_codon:yes gene_type:complete
MVVYCERIIDEDYFYVSDPPADLRVSEALLRRWIRIGILGHTDRRFEGEDTRDRVKLEMFKFPNGTATSREALRRFYLAINNQSARFRGEVL